jgi:hypothetical protein
MTLESVVVRRVPVKFHKSAALKHPHFIGSGLKATELKNRLAAVSLSLSTPLFKLFIIASVSSLIPRLVV